MKTYWYFTTAFTKNTTSTYQSHLAVTALTLLGQGPGGPLAHMDDPQGHPYLMAVGTASCTACCNYYPK